MEKSAFGLEMDFAKKVLEKHGWKEGDGLGRNSDGIVKPLKASMKFDKAGLGSNFAEEEFNNHWWQRVFDEAAGNIQIVNEEGEKGVRMGLKNSDDTLEISTKGYSVKKLEKLRKDRQQKQSKESIVNYGNFVPASKKEKVELNDQESSLKSSKEKDIHDISVAAIKVLSDDELFAACGGRTAHKGARHGLYLNGKLSRLQKQEAALFELLKTKNLKQTDQEVKHDKKTNSTTDEVGNSTENNDKELTTPLLTSSKTHKKKRKNKEKKQFCDDNQSNSTDVLEDKEPSERKRKKSKKSKRIDRLKEED